MNIVTSGYFDPIHVGHIEYFRLAKELGDRLIVIVNNRHQTLIKKRQEFMYFKERMEIVKSIRYVDEVVASIDKGPSVSETLEDLIQYMTIDIFAQGGDRYADDIPEFDMCNRLGIKIVDGLGEKIQSSTNLYNKVIGD